MTSFDDWRYNRDTTTTWHKNDIQHNRFYERPEFWLVGFLKFTKPFYTKRLIAENDTRIFNYDINKDLAKLGGIQQAEKELDKNVGDLSKIKFKQKNFFFCMMKAVTLITHSIQNLTKNSKYMV